jgi:two-component system nitrogen regulation response regulator GlnG
VDLSGEEIAQCFQRYGGDLDAMAETLEVSKRGLQRRMTQLGMPWH